MTVIKTWLPQLFCHSAHQFKILAEKDFGWLCSSVSCWSWTVNRNLFKSSVVLSWWISKTFKRRVSTIPLCSTMGTFFPPQAEREVPELLVHGHCSLRIWYCWGELCFVVFVTILQVAAGCSYSVSCLALCQTCPALLISSPRLCPPGPHHPDTISGGLSSATTTLLSLKKREPKLDTKFQLWFHQCQFGGALKLKWEQCWLMSIHCAPHILYW